ncbi:hypothetical protein HHI36_015730 [Cryptolaemus montrouzieri]|uniref:Uncharacterized protein n=1 Tax=Cryptolaemus montrouzieri TaxID=559131 RepID=A0ABD2N6N9_9CUCU
MIVKRCWIKRKTEIRQTDIEEGIEERENGSDTDQDRDSSSEEESQVHEWYLGKDKVTKRSKKHPSTKVRRGAYNVLLRLPGTFGNAREATTPYECWKCIVSPHISIIVKNTNIYKPKMQAQFSRERNAKPTDVMEYKCFIG